MKRFWYFILILIVGTLLAGCSNTATANPNDEVLKSAINLYLQKKQAGVDFKDGPCLGTIAPDWVLDIAHNPRQDIDDKPENTCADFATGKAHHFIELDPNGELIKTY